MKYIAECQFILATNGIPLSESNNLPLFELDIFLALSQEKEKQKMELLGSLSGVSHLAE